LTILVLGGGGFIGSALTQQLAEGGDTIRVFSRTANPGLASLPNCQQVVADFSDIPQLRKSLQGAHIVYHLISTTVPGTSNQDPAYDVESNLIGTIRLIELMKEARVSRIVFMSSGGTLYGATDRLPNRSSDPIAPLCSYGIVKHAIEKYLLMNEALEGLQPTIIRAANPYGIGQRHLGIQGIVGTFLNKIARDEELVIWGDGSARRDFLHISDLVSLLETAGLSDKTGVYHAGSGESHSIDELVNIIADIVGKRPRVKYLPARKFDVPASELDITETEKTFGWRPKLGLRDGLTECIGASTGYLARERESAII